MPSIMKSLNNISRSQAEFRRANLDDEILPMYYPFILTIISRPGRTQDAIAKEICVNKSTVARRVDWLEETGYVTRMVDKEDKRRLRVYPTDKCEELGDKLRLIAVRWNALLTAGISEDEFAVFKSVLSRMEASVKSAIFKESEQ